MIFTTSVYEVVLCSLLFYYLRQEGYVFIGVS